MGTWACLHAWHVCVSPEPSVCHVYGRKEQGHTHTRTHIHTCAPSHGKGGVTIAFTAAALRVAQSDEFFRVPAHTHHTRLCGGRRDLIRDMQRLQHCRRKLLPSWIDVKCRSAVPAGHVL